MNGGENHQSTQHGLGEKSRPEPREGDIRGLARMPSRQSIHRSQDDPQSQGPPHDRQNVGVEGLQNPEVVRKNQGPGAQQDRQGDTGVALAKGVLGQQGDSERPRGESEGHQQGVG